MPWAMSAACITTSNMSARNGRTAHVTTTSHHLCDREGRDELNRDDVLFFATSYLDNSLHLGGLGEERNDSINNQGDDWSDDESIDSLVVTKRRIGRMAQRND